MFAEVKNKLTRESCWTIVETDRMNACIYKGCTRHGTKRGDMGFMCLPHAALFLWMLEGPGSTHDRIKECDAVAELPDLEQVLRGPIWGPRIVAVLKGDK